MATLRRYRILALAFLLGADVEAATPHTQNPARPHRIAVVHTAVVPMDVERVLQDQTVVIEDGTIVALGPSSKVNVPVDALRVDGKGRYLLPALCDMHVHVVGESWNALLPPELRSSKELRYDDLLFPYLANGVTTVQELSASPESLILRARIDKGEVLGPRMILARMIDGPGKAWPPPLSVWVSSAAEAREAVRRAKAEGYDKMKAYSFLSKESYDAVASEAREVGMDVIGHIPNALSVEYVLDAKQKLIAHSEEVWKHAGDDKYDASRIDYFADLMAKRGVWMTPTLVTTRNILEVFADPDRHLARPESKYYRHPTELGVWSFIVDHLYGPVPPESRKALADALEKFQRPLTKAFHDKGGKMMAGSDTVIPYLVPGFSLHGELREMVSVGLTPYEALRTATTNPFEYLGESDHAGTIAIGKHPDLLLVDENPLKDVSAASKVAGVFVRGRWLGREEIQKRMKEVASSFDAMNRPVPQGQ